MRAILLFLLCAIMSAADRDHPFTLLRTESGNRFAMSGRKPARPRPTIFALGQSIERTLTDKDIAHIGWLLEKDGFLMVTLDIPCHGEDSRPGEPPRLNGWAFRTSRGEDLVGPFVKRASDVLDWLVSHRYADRSRIAAYGISRGGFMALHFAAADPRVRCVAAVAPVTNMGQLSEFQGQQDTPLVASSAVHRVAGALAPRSLWIVIGSQDDRVGTDSAIQLNRAIAQAASKSEMMPDMTMIIGPWKGHSVDPSMDVHAAHWIRSRCGARSNVP